MNVPEGAREVVAEFQFLSHNGGGGPHLRHRQMLNPFDMASLYLAGYYVRQIPVQATVTYPAGWTPYSALRGKMTGATMA